VEIRRLGGVLDVVLRITIRVVCVVGTFLVSRYALSVVVR